MRTWAVRAAWRALLSVSFAGAAGRAGWAGWAGWAGGGGGDMGRWKGDWEYPSVSTNAPSGVW